MRFRNLLLSNFPFLEDDFDALTDYQLFCKMIAYVKKIYINNEKFVTELTANLEKMYEDGKFDSLIEEIVNLQITFTYDTVTDMKLATNLVNGCYTKTLGYNSIFDGGDAYYYIRTKTNEDTVDDIFILDLSDENLIAELIVKNNEVNVKQSGLTGNSSDDATSKLALLFGSGYDLYFPSGTYNTTSGITLISHNIRGHDSSDTIIKYNGVSNNSLITSNDLSKVMLKDICFDCGNLRDIVKTAINLYDTNGLKILDCEFKNGYGSQLRLNGSQNILIENCYFHDIDGATSNMGNCIYCHPVKNLTIKKCTCNNVHEDFLYLDGNPEDPVINVYVDNNNLHHTGYENNETSANCIGINGDCRNIFITNNIISNNINGIKTASRYDTLPSNIFINNNVINNNSQNGCGLGGYYISVNNNIVYNNNQDGIYCINANNVIVDNNKVYNNTRTGIYFNSVNHGNISKCQVFDNTSSGILCGVNSTYTCNNISISDCEVYKTDTGTQTTGIQMLYVNYAKVLSNKVYDNVVDVDIYRSTVTDLISQLNPTQGQSNVKSIMYSSGIPASGAYNTGDIVLFTTPTAGDYIGAVCVSGGSPGTWKYFGSISS